MIALEIYMEINSLSIETGRILNGLEVLSRHKLSPPLVKPNDIQLVITQLKTSLLSKGYRLGIDNSFQLFQMETSHLFFKNQTLMVFVHIPSYKHKELLTLYKVRPLPVFMNLGTKTEQAYATPKVTYSYIAISANEERFQTFNELTLSHCQSVLDVYVCPNNNVIEKYTDWECLVAIYKGDANKVRATCPWRAKTRDEALQINSTSFAVFAHPRNPDTLCLLYTSPSPRDRQKSRMPSSA